jgi:hypothetical protein
MPVRRLAAAAAGVATFVAALLAGVLAQEAAEQPHEVEHFMISSQNECPTYFTNASERVNIRGKFDRLMALLARYDAVPLPKTTTRLAYYKTHKTGSSTMHAVMINFARKHDLVPVNAVVDYQSHEGVHLGCPDTLRSQPATKGAFDIEFRHLLESKTFMHLNVPGKCYKVPGFFDGIVESYEWLIDGPGTPIVTTFREPVSQFVSSFGYYAFRQLPYSNHRNPWTWEDALVDYVGGHEAVFNIVAKDFGFTASPDGAAAFGEKYLKSDRVLGVVLERLMESLVVMRRSLGWDFADMLHLVTNEAGVSKKQEKTAPHVTNATRIEETMSKIASLQEGVDDVVYRAAVAQLDRRVATMIKEEEDEGGSRGRGSSALPCFAQEVADLNWAVGTLATLCGCSGFLQSDYLTNYRRANNGSFDLVYVCDSFDEEEVNREISMTHEHNAELNGTRLRTELGAVGMKALNYDEPPPVQKAPIVPKSKSPTAGKTPTNKGPSATANKGSSTASTSKSHKTVGSGGGGGSVGVGGGGRNNFTHHAPS